MNREKAKELLPIIKAFAEGKTIEYINPYEKDGEWSVIGSPTWNTYYNYRIKPEPTYRPFNSMKECWQEMQKHQPFGWLKYNEVYYNINVVSSLSVCIINGNCEHMDFKFALEKLTFADGTPFGIKEEE